MRCKRLPSSITETTACTSRVDQLNSAWLHATAVWC